MIHIPPHPARVFAAAAFGLVLLVPGYGADKDSAARGLHPMSYRTITSRSRRFLVVTTNPQWGLDLARWSEGVAGRLTRATHLDLPDTPWWAVHIALREDPEKEGSGVYVSQSFRGENFVQRLIISNYETADIRLAEEHLCLLLLNSAVVHAQVSVGVGADSRIDMGKLRREKRLYAAPRWLAIGLSENMHKESRAENSRAGVTRWDHGDLPGLRAFIDTPSRFDNPPDRVLCSLVTGWLLSFPAEKEVFSRLIKRLAEGEKLSAEWLARKVLGLDGAKALDAQWAQWIDRERRTVYEPGTVTSHDLRVLGVELLLSEGGSDIPLGSIGSEQIGFKDLIAHRDAPWIPGFALRKASRLQVLAAGRGAALVEVVGLYCEFLKALEARKGADVLQLRLAAAESARAALEQQVSSQAESEGDQDAAPGAVRRETSGKQE